MICPLCEKEIPALGAQHLCVKDNTGLFRQQRSQRNYVPDSEFPELTHEEDFFDVTQEVIIGES